MEGDMVGDITLKEMYNSDIAALENDAKSIINRLKLENKFQVNPVVDDRIADINGALLEQEVITAMSYAFLARTYIRDIRPEHYKTVPLGIIGELETEPSEAPALEMEYYEFAKSLEDKAEKLASVKIKYDTHADWFKSVVEPNAELIEKRIMRSLTAKF